MIIIGYPGIGKSTLAATDNRYIDLESSCFTVDGKKIDDWYVAYCQVAEHLSKQGYIVFVSSHADVVRYLSKVDLEAVAIVYPSIKLRDQWVEKLRQRFDDSGLEKDYLAWVRSIEHYEDDVRALMEVPYTKYGDRFICGRVELDSMDYDLKERIKPLIRWGDVED